MSQNSVLSALWASPLRQTFRGTLTGASMLASIMPAHAESGQKNLFDIIFGGGTDKNKITTNGPVSTAPSAAASTTKGRPKFDANLRTVPARVSGNILIRYFKAEGELEIWESNSTGEFKERKTFAISKMGSRGKLGPKQREGDMTTPEGIWHITRAHLAATASFSIPVKIPYPNALETYQGKTGSEVLFHNDIGMIADPASTASCVALENSDLPIFRGIVEAAFNHGQSSIQVQGFPFRMTNANMSKYGNASKQSVALWSQLRPIYNAFETTKTQPSVNYCATGYKLGQNTTENDVCVPATVQNTGALRVAVATGKKFKPVQDEPALAYAAPEQPRLKVEMVPPTPIRKPIVTAKQVPVVTAPATPAFTAATTPPPAKIAAVTPGTPAVAEKPMRLGPPGPDEIVIPVEIIFEAPRASELSTFKPTDQEITPNSTMKFVFNDANAVGGVTTIAKTSCGKGVPMVNGACPAFLPR